MSKFIYLEYDGLRLLHVGPNTLNPQAKVL